MTLTDHIRTTFAAAALEFDIAVSDFRTDIEISGSPERSEMRSVIESTEKKLYVLECVFDEDVNQKKKIAYTLDYLRKKNILEINPYLNTTAGESVALSRERFWMMSPFIKGIPLKRPDYVFEKWRAGALSAFLMTLKEKSEGLEKKIAEKPFSIIAYIHKLMEDIKENDPQVLSGLGPVLSFLECDFMEQHDSLPLRFCHGDYHPINVIWNQKGINSVIDWEFSGVKPEAYDLANLIGCLGIENPHSLSGELVIDLVSSLYSSDFMEHVSWETLIPFILAIRFAWLSEWLRRRDAEMVELELVYMNLIRKNADRLKDFWFCKA